MSQRQTFQDALDLLTLRISSELEKAKEANTNLETVQHNQSAVSFTLALLYLKNNEF